VSVIGTRPEAIKMEPVIRALSRLPWIDQQLVLTGQHAGLAAMLPKLGGCCVRQLRYDPRGRTPAGLRESLHRTLCRHLAPEAADLVLVHGDTTTALAGAFAARDLGIPVGHVEAGLRTFDFRRPWPEEGHRTAIDALSALLFAPTGTAARNLERDWRVKGHIFVTGNTGIDALFAARTGEPAPAAPGTGDERKTVLVTCHRKENQGEPARRVCAALKRLVREHPLDIVLPLHLNPHVRAPFERLLAGEPRISLVEPLLHGDMVRLMERCWLILTDSGGLQEEGAALGRPVLVLRDVTERGEAVESENVALVGTCADRVTAEVAGLLADPDRYERMAQPTLAFGDGRAAPRIASAIDAWLEPRA
jgi:UDP-N-acetylglucosamine 2-epimerase (non-hydrolysing)